MPSYSPNAVQPYPGDETPDLVAILCEVGRGRELQDWYDGESEKYVAFKPAEAHGLASSGGLLSAALVLASLSGRLLI